ncbi:hypothetical protein AUEXF2481DRAFT_44818 [Aureobasidium subglaciale EXF-2481]|uniref:Complex 1 LYR protein domain-containing protein n=1 Tax=Aureobasidium subglaciale (strain EXF-2481) TaxID=1043005 RepID=A0A074Y9B2_AURSE|nr:uncharacterized protein AUEXF2481DRAFT_44818 [Aureobasidium subglaciale EXF-2481]KAI5206672.1 hypothetical protein E4T38_03794 [Aureobasidium subglaciale]KAI5217553.1 hypothetical protein E4T41_08817 [Aureobasidium subglaciale]KAI5225422.1 hypothetical protein E4T40_03569 [Aureobasidium subglaciale]KAI5255106.1 hypothetical protein E4T46_08851 [Aureobasidium subglaciale]KEQ90767.1 hypothetical protein AUEXF2481DRAFT_44818 [Aureobasidium subglaciale EXF-2481]
MPAFLAPHKSGAHRVTAIALYRALITKCRNAPEPLKSAVLAAVVRNKFKQNRHVTSINALRVAFEGGYEALDHLNAAIKGDEREVDYLSTLLSRLPAWMKAIPQNPTPPPPPPPPTAQTSPPQDETQKPPTKRCLLHRPRPLFSLPSRRRIPTLVSANKIPILRLKKPQSASLSKYLKSRILDRQKRLDRKTLLESAMEVARGEDEWDRILLAQGVDVGQGKQGKGGHGKQKGREEPWTKNVYEALGNVYNKIEEEGRRNKEMAEKMVGIIEKEKEFAEVERRERRRVGNEERRRRKAEKDGKVGEDGMV